MSFLFMESNLAKMRRILEESLDVAFVICLNKTRNFYPAMIRDTFCQIFPTAFVLETGYWPFYRTVQHKFLCVCRRFNLDCKHVKTPLAPHCINLEPSKSCDNNNNNSNNQFFRIHTKVRPMRYHIQITSTPANLPKGYLVSIRLKVVGDYKTGKDRTKEVGETFHFHFRFTVVPLSLPPEFSVTFVKRPDFVNFAEDVLKRRELYEFPKYLLEDFKLPRAGMCTWTLCPDLVISFGPQVRQNVVSRPFPNIPDVEKKVYPTRLEVSEAAATARRRSDTLKSLNMASEVLAVLKKVLIQDLNTECSHSGRKKSGKAGGGDRERTLLALGNK